MIEEQIPDTIVDIVARAQVIRRAADKLQKLKDEAPAAVEAAATRVQAMTRGKSARNVFADLAAEAQHRPSGHSNGESWGAKARAAAAAAADESKAYGEARAKGGKHAAFAPAGGGQPAAETSAGGNSLGKVARRAVGVSKARKALTCLVGARAVVVRAEAALSSSRVGELKEGTAVRVLDTVAMPDGTIRVAVALASDPLRTYGWITGARDDGSETLQVTSESAAILTRSDQGGSHGLVALLHGEKREDAAVDIQRIERGRSSRSVLAADRKKASASGALPKAAH